MPPLSTQQPPQIETPNYLLRTTVAILALALVGTASYFGYQNYRRQAPQEITNNGYLSLKEKMLFREAWNHSQSGNYQDAVELYRQVQTSTPEEYSFVQFEIANALLNIDKLKGLEAFTEVYASSSVNQITKAYVLNALANRYMSTYDETIISTLSNSKVLREASPELTLRLSNAKTPREAVTVIFELSSSYFPLSDSEIYLAYFYAIKAAQAKESADEETFNKYKDISLKKIESADADFEKSKDTENLKWMYPLRLNRKAMALGYLERAGVSVENPENYFEQSLLVAASQGTYLNAFMNHNYAIYLYHKYGSEKAEKIASLLKPLVENRGSRTVTSFINYAKNAYKNNQAENIKNLDALAKIYPPFGEIIR